MEKVKGIVAKCSVVCLKLHTRNPEDPCTFVKIIVKNGVLDFITCQYSLQKCSETVLYLK